MKPPQQLRSCLFCRIKKGEKVPFEKDWQNRGYTFEEIQKYNDKENYGVLAGVGGLCLLDDDSKDKILHKIYNENFPESFQIRGHIYFYLEGWDCKKKKLYFNPKGKNKEEKQELGEIQGIGTQGVCAGSLHPSGQTYKIIKDIPIVKLKWSDFYEVFGKFIKEEPPQNTTPLIKNNFEGDNINDISITNIFSSNLNKCPSCGCSSGTNFKIYPETNSYFCFHSWTGGGIWEAIAISEGIKNCSDIGRSCLNDSEKQQILTIAQTKYGLKIFEFNEEKAKPMGWACSLNIKKIALRRNFLKCPLCNLDFQFNEHLGFYRCGCQRGGIKKFMTFYLTYNKILKEKIS